VFKLSNRSKDVYVTLHEDLRKVIDKALLISPIDFGLSEGYRSPEKQFEYFKRGREEIDGEWKVINKSKVITYMDGYEKKSKHNYNPAHAFDFFVWVPGKKNLMYDLKHMVALDAVFVSIANDLYKKGEIKNEVRCGFDWDRDGEILYDQSFDDLPHVELII